MDGMFGGATSPRRWFAVKAQPRKEALAAFHLKRQGFAAFLPSISQVLRRPTKTETVQRPFFPGYLFVKLDLDLDRWRSVNGTIGVSSLVQFGARPSPVPMGLVEDLVELADEGGEVRFDDRLRPGMEVRLVGGAFDRISGIFQGAEGEDRVRVLMTLMSREMSVTVPRSVVMAVR